ncbi:MAG: MBL fold metallo-hydrolase [Deltaproteobacteria bacterium]|nr:MBL fold metallo-hydrolase [Deltaproteobacteria bacterium]
MHICGNIYGFIWESMTQNNCNTYLIDGSKRILVDPGHLDLFDHVKDGLAELGLGVTDIDLVICTHAHPDHLEAAGLFQETAAQLTYHEADWSLVKTMMAHHGAAFQMSVDAVRPDFFLSEGDLHVGDMNFQVFHTPGHAPGAICIYQPDEGILITGDLVFKDGVGRTDLPGGDGPALKESIRRVAGLDVNWILPGHGATLSGRDDVKRNFQQIESFWFAHI